MAKPLSNYDEYVLINDTRISFFHFLYLISFYLFSLFLSPFRSPSKCSLSVVPADKYIFYHYYHMPMYICIIHFLFLLFFLTQIKKIYFLLKITIKVSQRSIQAKLSTNTHYRQASDPVEDSDFFFFRVRITYILSSTFLHRAARNKNWFFFLCTLFFRRQHSHNQRTNFRPSHSKLVKFVS